MDIGIFRQLASFRNSLLLVRLLPGSRFRLRPLLASRSLLTAATRGEVRAEGGPEAGRAEAWEGGPFAAQRRL